MGAGKISEGGSMNAPSATGQRLTAADIERIRDDIVYTIYSRGGQFNCSKADDDATQVEVDEAKAVCEIAIQAVRSETRANDLQHPTPAPLTACKNAEGSASALTSNSQDGGKAPESSARPIQGPCPFCGADLGRSSADDCEQPHLHVVAAPSSTREPVRSYCQMGSGMVPVAAGSSDGDWVKCEDYRNLEVRIAAALAHIHDESLGPRNRLQGAAARLCSAESASRPITHVICFEGEGAEVLLCRGWEDCREQFFNGIFGDGHHDWDAEQVKLWDADFANDDSWNHDESGRRYCFTSDIGEISKVRIYCVARSDGTPHG